MKKLIWNYEFPNPRYSLNDQFAAKLDNTNMWIAPDIVSYRPITLGAFQKHVMNIARQYNASIISVRKMKDIPDNEYISFNIRKHTINSYFFIRRKKLVNDISTTEEDIVYADEIFKNK